MFFNGLKDGVRSRPRLPGLWRPSGSARKIFFAGDAFNAFLFAAHQSHCHAMDFSRRSHEARRNCSASGEKSPTLPLIYRPGSV